MVIGMLHLVDPYPYKQQSLVWPKQVMFGRSRLTVTVEQENLSQLSCGDIDWHELAAQRTDVYEILHPSPLIDKDTIHIGQFCS